MVGLSSTRYTLKPDSASSRAAYIPDIPPPITATAPTGCTSVTNLNLLDEVDYGFRGNHVFVKTKFLWRNPE